jgi:hypothetical protein
MLALVFIAAIIVIGAFLFASVEWFEPNTRVAVIFKCAIIAARGAVIGKSSVPLKSSDEALGRFRRWSGRGGYFGNKKDAKLFL